MKNVSGKHAVTIFAGFVLSFCMPVAAFAADQANSGDTAWVLISSALVLLMLPGLAFFYGGMVRKKNVLSSMMHIFAVVGVIGVQWVVVGYTLAFGPEGGSFIGGFGKMFLRGVGPESLSGSIPELVFVMFQGMFAIITPALIAGAIAERVKFGPYLIFVLLWSTLIYDPLAHWVWGEGGWLLEMGALDFAGGTVVHISSGVSALAAIWIIGKRKNWPQTAMLPHNMTLTLLGAGLLWFGWFGFNAGSALAANGSAALAFANTQIAAATACCTWMLGEWFYQKRPSALGVASGIVAGLVAITPAAGFVTPAASIVVGGVAGVLCYAAVIMKGKLGYDDSLDAFGIHGVGGTWGALATGIFATIGGTGLLAGNSHQFFVQLISVVAVAAYAFIGTFILVKVIDLIFGFRVSSDDETVGLDETIHGETGYNF